MNGGLSCCSRITEKDFPHQQIKYNDPKEKCDDLLDCPDQNRKCSSSAELSGQLFPYSSVLSRFNFSSISDVVSCPQEFPFPFLDNGRLCCKWYKRTLAPDKNPRHTFHLKTTYESYSIRFFVDIKSKYNMLLSWKCYKSCDGGILQMDDPVECCEAPHYVRCDSGRSRCTKGANETS